jgi:hypothetical protein
MTLAKSLHDENVLFFEDFLEPVTNFQQNAILVSTISTDGWGEQDQKVLTCVKKYSLG